MYALQLAIYASKSLIGSAIYERLADRYHLPSVQALLISMTEEIEWHCDSDVQVYFLDNLREANRRNLFQVRFRVSKEGQNFASIFVGVDEKLAQVHTLTLQFPPKGDRRCTSFVISQLKELTKVHRQDAEFEIAGFGERATYRYICEHSLSAFVWNAALQRYLHVTDQVSQVKEVVKDMKWKKDRKDV